MEREAGVSDKYIAIFGGRKFLATIACGLATSLLTWFGKIDSGTYALVILGTVGTFIGGNVFVKSLPANRVVED